MREVLIRSRCRRFRCTKDVREDEADHGVGGEDDDQADGSPDNRFFAMSYLLGRSGRGHPSEAAPDEYDQGDGACDSQESVDDFADELLRSGYTAEGILQGAAVSTADRGSIILGVNVCSYYKRGNQKKIEEEGYNRF